MVLEKDSFERDCWRKSNLTVCKYLLGEDFGCQSRSSLGYLDDIFTLGYDISLANPVGKRALARPVLQKSLLHECRLTGDDHCQPHARSKVIDSIGAYHKWIRDQIILDPNSNGTITFS